MYHSSLFGTDLLIMYSVILYTTNDKSSLSEKGQDILLSTHGHI
jgi:hypothetical protein